MVRGLSWKGICVFVLGVTGSQLGASTAQLHTFKSWVLENWDKIEAVHNGCCVGWDTQVAYILHGNGLEELVVWHPPSNSDKQGIFQRDWPMGEWRKPKPYLDRNWDIAKECDVVIGAPRTDEEQIRSGTWATLRYARKLGKEVKVLRRMGGWLEW